MKAATLNQIRKELETSSHKRVLEIALRLIRFKSENKELISYLLFDSDDLSGYIADVKYELSEMFNQFYLQSPNQIKRSLRRALKFISRYSKYTQVKETEAELLIYFCNLMNEKGLIKYHNKVNTTIYNKQLDKVEKMLPVLQEELQVDYRHILTLLRK